MVRNVQACAALAQALLLIGVSSQHAAPFLAPSLKPVSVPRALLAAGRAPAPAPALAVAASPMMAPAASPMAALPDCKGTCEQAKKMWKEAEETQRVAIEIQKNQTASRIKAEADLLVEDVKLKVHSQAEADVKGFGDRVKFYLDGRVQAFNNAVAARHGQVLQAKGQQFEAVKIHQGQVMEGLMSDVVQHGFEVARNQVAIEAGRAGANFNGNKEVQHALAEVRNAGDAWAATYHTSEDAARLGFASWSGSYNGLAGPWSNITATFNKANDAAVAARGLGPDTRWANEIVRVSGDVTQAGQTESQKSAAHGRLAMDMANKVHNVVAGNSGSIGTLTEMLDRAESAANQAAMAR